jgi:hypothetical protein
MSTLGGAKVPLDGRVNPRDVPHAPEEEEEEGLCRDEASSHVQHATAPYIMLA